MRTVTTEQAKGFSLIELMIAVAIVGILAAIAYPSYKEYVVRSNRADAQQLLMQGAQQAERHFAQQNTYDNMTGAFLFGGESSVKSGGIYTFEIDGDETDATSFLLRATPAAGKANAGDGNLEIDQTGNRIWKHPGGDRSWSDR